MNCKKQNPWITAKQAERIIEAAEFAAWLGIPLNTTVTIHWALAGGPGHGNWRERQARLFEHIRHWLNRRGSEWAAVWTVEAGREGKDVHVHFVMHLPPEIEENELRCYLLSQLQAEVNSVIKVKPVQSWDEDSWMKGGLKGWLSYMLKGVDPMHYDTFNITKKNRNTQGIVFGKRCGMTQNVGLSAQN